MVLSMARSTVGLKAADDGVHDLCRDPKEDSDAFAFGLALASGVFGSNDTARSCGGRRSLWGGRKRMTGIAVTRGGSVRAARTMRCG